MLKAIPTLNHLARVYFELAMIGAESAGADKAWPYKTGTKEELVCLASEMSRFDPRLFEILVKFFIKNWRDLDPLHVRMLYKQMECPQTVAVICEFAKLAMLGKEAELFFEYLMAGILPVSFQFYFHNLYKPGGDMARRAVEEGVYEFKKWGFFANKLPIADSLERRTVGSLDVVSRRNVLARIVKDKKEISLGDYLKEIRNGISRQQALADIKSSGFLKRIGKGRGAKWKMAA